MIADEFIRLHADEPVEQLAFRLQQHKEIDAAYVLRQIEGRQRMARKVPSLAQVDGLRFPMRLSMEQCSGEVAARYKADLVARRIGSRRCMADLTGGFGIDFAFLSPLFDEAHYVERQDELVELAAHNLPLMDARATTVEQGEAAEWLARAEQLDLVFLDPARRDEAGRKVVLLDDCEPNVKDLLPLLRRKCRYALVKLSPMLDIASCLQSLPAVAEVHVVAEKGECKELLLLLDFTTDKDPDFPDETVVFCHDGFDFCFTRTEEAQAVAPGTDRVMRYLYEPSAALLKAGAFKVVVARYGLLKLHPDSHLYTSDELVNDFPGRRFRVLRTSRFAKPQLRAFVDGVKRANLTVRNFPGTVAALRKRLRVAEGGEEYWFATTLNDQTHVLIACEKVSPIEKMV